jgi:hypothetical protein
VCGIRLAIKTGEPFIGGEWTAKATRQALREEADDLFARAVRGAPN